MSFLLVSDVFCLLGGPTDGRGGIWEVNMDIILVFFLSFLGWNSHLVLYCWALRPKCAFVIAFCCVRRWCTGVLCASSSTFYIFLDCLLLSSMSETGHSYARTRRVYLCLRFLLFRSYVCIGVCYILIYKHIYMLLLEKQSAKARK